MRTTDGKSMPSVDRPLPAKSQSSREDRFDREAIATVVFQEVHVLEHPQHRRKGFSRAAPPSRAAISLDENSWSATEAPQWTSPSEALIADVVSLLWDSEDAPRFGILHNAVPTLMRAANMTFDEAAVATQAFRTSLCDKVYEVLVRRFPEIVNPEGFDLKPFDYLIDGFNVNVMGNGAGFYSTKQLHFDIVEPIGSNLYGPNKNISGGLPAFADVREYCASNGLEITDILEKIVGERVLTLKPEHYLPVVEKFSIAFDVDMVGDTPFSIVLNRVVAAGVMHGATLCHKTVPDAEVMRPIRHYEYCDMSQEAADKWYATLGQSNDRAPGKNADKPFIPATLTGQASPFVIKPS
ncbi:hypothetical protein [Rhizobium laguerreae]|uniref:hypothetical protein n=1 Tax=Rhizobium laguerreae TaxID=1076926 RepID=UPI001C8FB136|nr:hypothetical protein [Rhizobium laguerreae]MBY3203470.1 hypothetical protein [Rhizobium laguerreae]